MKKLLSVAALLGSTTTIVCCFLPALFVTLGFGATFASLLGFFPQLTWISEHKAPFFAGAGALILVAGILQWRSRKTECPIDPTLAEGCGAARSWAKPVLFLAAALYSLGFFFAFVIPALMT
jgi:hypothetical protein